MPVEKIWIRNSVEISASKEVIWNVITDATTYQDWSSAFMPGSRFEGDWSEGSKIRFIGPSDEGVNGICAKVLTHVPGDSLTMQHIAVISNGVELYEGEDFETWIPATEEYWLEPLGEGCRLRIVSQTPEAYFESFSESWRNALSRIKILAESGS